jgi:Arc/MetJ-type ribon-helix-helix transcriptional regulator
MQRQSAEYNHAEKSTMPAGRPKSDIETEVIAVRASVELRERLDAYLDYLFTREGIRASRSAMIEHALRIFLDAKEQERERRRRDSQQLATPTATVGPGKTPSIEGLGVIDKNIAQQLLAPTMLDEDFTQQLFAQPKQPLSKMRREIIELLRQHPEGLSPVDTRKLLGAEKDLGSTMKSMARDGFLRRLEIGRYSVAIHEATPLAKR